jgi:PAS domain S-box-containing protein
MSVESARTSPRFGVSSDLGQLALLSALAEAPDLALAGTLLLTDILAATGATRGCLLRLDSPGKRLLLTAQVGFDEPRPDSLATGEADHPWMISTLTLAPVEGEGPAHAGAHIAFDRWTALPIPRAASTPGGVLIIDATMSEDALRSVASLAALAGPVLFRVAAHLEATSGFDRVSQERSRFREMVDSLPDPVVITDAANKVVVQNKRAEHLLFVTDDASPERRRAVDLNNRRFGSLLAHATIGDSPAGPRELNLLDPDKGHELLFEVLMHPLGERAGPDDPVLSVLRDVTDLRRAARELERQVQRVRQAEIEATDERDRLNLILENVADPILVTDSSGNIILMNDEAERLFLGPHGTAQSIRVSQAVRHNDTKFMSFIADFALTDERTRRQRMSLTRPMSAIEVPIEVVSGKIGNDRGEPIAIVSVLHDLTQQVENERLYDALKQLNSELEGRIALATADLEQQNERLTWQSEELAKANKLKSDFLASMSHELRTPLNAVIGYSALLLDGIAGDLAEGQRDYVMRSRNAAQHLLSLINDILDLARIEAGKMPVYVESVSLPELISEVAQQVEPMVAAKKLQFNVSVDPGCPQIESDKTKVKQILLNLLSNAIKFTNRGFVGISVTCTRDAVQLEVNDSGVGIKSEEIDSIWEDFRQLDQSRTRSHGGTGLGLSITRRLTQQLGGRISVRSTFGEGTTFSVRLPMALQASGIGDGVG